MSIRSLCLKLLIFALICRVGSTQVVCLANGTTVQCGSPVCPGTEMTLNSTTMPLGNNWWKLPSGSCPSKVDTIQLIQGSGASCSGSADTCGPYRAQNSGPDASGRCLTSTLTFVVSVTTLVQCGASDSNGNPSYTTSINIMAIAPPGPLTVPNFSTLNETYLTVTWAPPTTGGVPTRYSASINDSSGTTVVIPGNGSPLYNYTFKGLTSNTLYSISVVAINCAGTSNTATVYNYTLAPAPLFVTAQLSAPDAAPYVNVTWQGVLGVSNYLVSSIDPPKLQHVLCPYSSMPCFSTVMLPQALQSGQMVSACVASLNMNGFAGTQVCYPCTASSAVKLEMLPWLLSLLMLLIYM